MEPITSIVTDLNALVKDGAKFGTIYADPPWPYGNQATRAATSNHYSTMTMSDICELPVSSLSAENCHLHLWTTNGFLRESFNVIDAWGFEYKSCMVWVKPNLGIGNYWRVSHEFLLLGIKGKAPFRNRSMKSWIEVKRAKHSTKPLLFREAIEKTSPQPMLELFGRMAVDGWSVWGNEVRKDLLTDGIKEWESCQSDSV